MQTGSPQSACSDTQLLGQHVGCVRTHVGAQLHHVQHVRRVRDDASRNLRFHQKETIRYKDSNRRCLCRRIRTTRPAD